MKTLRAPKLAWSESSSRLNFQEIGAFNATDKRS